MLPVASPVMLLCAATHCIAHCTIVRCCPSHRLSCRRGLLPVVSPVTPPWSAARRVACRAAVQCCLSHCLSCHCALLPMVSPLHHSVQLPVVLPVALVTIMALDSHGLSFSLI